MFKVILFVTLIACVFASWDPSDGRRKHLQSVHQPEVSHRKGFGHVGHVGHAASDVEQGRGSRQAHGQVESVAHGGGTVYKNKEFKRVKKGHHTSSKHTDGGKRDNQLRRIHSRKHYKH